MNFKFLQEVRINPPNEILDLMKKKFSVTDVCRFSLNKEILDSPILRLLIPISFPYPPLRVKTGCDSY